MLPISKNSKKIDQTNLSKYGYRYPTQNNEIKQRAIDAQLKSGKYFDPESKSDWAVYNSISHFQSIITDYIDTPTDKQLFETHGVFSSKKNPNGVVRDHMLSRRDGFTHKIYPEILRHPANCQIILHKDNARKKSNSSITVDELFSKNNQF